ncbi:MAG: efflux RND transporter periplasmic adaptor subunit [Oceanospirillaceae bacterium]|nr:efflux RND transporter periplasmic adaptor subunit [Oceanospirillaceae bacterium]
MFQQFTTIAVLAMALGMAPAASAESERIMLTEAQQARLGVQTGDAQMADRQALVVVPGRISTPLDAMLTVPAPFAGIVQAIQALEGAEVNAGDVLLSITSNDYLETQARHAQAMAEFKVLKASAERLKTLAGEGVVAEARAEAAEADAARAKAELAATKRLLAQVKPAEGHKGAYNLIAPKDARIAELTVMPGEMIDMLDSAVVLEDAGNLWVEAELPSRFLGQTSAGEKVSLQPSGIEAEIIAIGRTVDQKSRSVTVRARLDANDGLRPGQSVQVTIFGRVEAGALSVPREAVVRLAGGEVVFLAEGGGYRIVPVTVLSRGVDKAIIKGEISPGAKVATRALTELKALALEGE